VDAFVEVTHRPPEQPLFGRRIVEWALQQHPGEPYIHLGDVLDLSCRVEGRLLDGAAYADSFLAQRLKLPRTPGTTAGRVWACRRALCCAA
jgi:hypothetical protein